MSKKGPLRLERLVKAIQFTSDKKTTLADIADAIRYSRDHFTAIYKKAAGDHLYEAILSEYKSIILKGLENSYFEFSGQKINLSRPDPGHQKVPEQKSGDPKGALAVAQKLAEKLNPGQAVTKGMQSEFQKLLKKLETGTEHE